MRTLDAVSLLDVACGTGEHMASGQDQAWLDAPARAMAAAAFDQTARRGAQHADFRLSRRDQLEVRVRDMRLQGSDQSSELGFGVRVIVDRGMGVRGRHRAECRSRRPGHRAGDRRGLFAKPTFGNRVELAAEPRTTTPHGLCLSGRPAGVPSADGSPAAGVEPAAAQDGRRRPRRCAASWYAKEHKFYADPAGTDHHPAADPAAPGGDATVGGPVGGFETMRTLAPPVGRGWEYLTGTGWDWDGELAEFPELLAEKAEGALGRARALRPRHRPDEPVADASTSPSGTPPSSTGPSATRPPTPARRSPPPTSSARLRYGSPVMNVTGDRTAEHGLATIGYDDEGVAAQSWDLIRDGDARRLPARPARSAALMGCERSNGCAYADSPRTSPSSGWPTCRCSPPRAADDRRADRRRRATASTSSATSRWSIDMQRYNFQFTGQRFYRIRDGRLAGQLRDVAYQATTTDFWGAMEAVGGPPTYLLGGAFNCGKGQPGQLAAGQPRLPVGAVPRRPVLNTAKETTRA